MKYQIINSTWLKIIGCIFMIIDHLALVAVTIDNGRLISLNSDTYHFLRILGRISFPLFAFLIIDGMFHTKNRIKYLYRLAVLAFAVMVANAITTQSYSGNPITCLFLGALSIYILEKPKYYKGLIILPLIYVFLCFFEVIPLRIGYNIYGYFLMLLFYLSYKLAKIISNESDNSMKYTNYRNIFSCFSIIIMALFFYFMGKYSNIQYFEVQMIQMYTIFSCIFIILYNGNKGYNKTWFKWFWYLFYPVHIGVIYIIYYGLTLIL